VMAVEAMTPMAMSGFGAWRITGCSRQGRVAEESWALGGLLNDWGARGKCRSFDFVAPKCGDPVATSLRMTFD
jgi:hypothetical protein